MASRKEDLWNSVTTDERSFIVGRLYLEQDTSEHNDNPLILQIAYSEHSCIPGTRDK